MSYPDNQKYPQFPPENDNLIKYDPGFAVLKHNTLGIKSNCKLCAVCKIPTTIRVILQDCLHLICFQCYSVDTFKCRICDQLILGVIYKNEYEKILTDELRNIYILKTPEQIQEIEEREQQLILNEKRKIEEQENLKKEQEQQFLKKQQMQKEASQNILLQKKEIELINTYKQYQYQQQLQLQQQQELDASTQEQLEQEGNPQKQQFQIKQEVQEELNDIQEKQYEENDEEEIEEDGNYKDNQNSSLEESAPQEIINQKIEEEEESLQ